MQYDIFISYSRKDKIIVESLVQEFESLGYRVWIDRTGIHSGVDFKSTIVQAIEDSQLFLFFSSKASNNSSWTSKEIGIAIDRNKLIIPIKLDNSRYNKNVEFDLINLDYIDFSNKSSRKK